MKLLLLLICVVAANAATISSRKCAYGPTYWCGSILQAKECGAVQYCTDNDWTNIETKDGELCTDCMSGIPALREEVNKASTEDGITKAIKSFCHSLGGLGEDCEILIEAYGTKVLKALINKLEPKQMCALMAFCKPVDVQKEDISLQVASLLMTQAGSTLMRVIQNQLFVNSDNCADCTAFFGDVKDKLNDPAFEKGITNDLLMVCQYLGAYQSECELMVTTLVPRGIGLLVENLDPKQVCTEIGFCGSSSAGEPIPEPPPNDPCSDCKAFMGDVKTLLSNATVQKMIIEDLESLCNDLGSLAPQCQQYVGQYGPIAITLLLQQFDPASVCGVIRFCPAVDAPVMGPSDDGCSECKLAVQAFTGLISDPGMQTEIINGVSEVCTVLGPEASECKQIVSQYGPMVFSLILQVMNPSSFCSEIGFCAVISEPEALPEPGDICQDCENFVNDIDNLLNNYTVQVASNDTCAECKSVFQDLQKLLSDPAVLKMFVQDLELLCNDLGPIGPECKQLVDEYGEMVFNFLIQYLDPDALCSAIGLCPRELKLSLPRPINNDQCADCRNFLQDVVTMLNTPYVQNQIIEGLESICKDLGPKIAPQCQQYVSEYGLLAIDYLLQYLDPSAICNAIKFCSSTSSEKLVFHSNADQCSDCKAFFGDVVKDLNEPATQKMVLEEISELCNDLGPSIGPQCQQYVAEYGPLAFNYLLQYLDPEAVCGDIGFCPAISRPVLLVNENADQCTDCKNFFGDISNMLKNASVQQEILKEIGQLCDYLGPSLGPTCQLYVSQYGPMVFDFLLPYLDPTTICGEIGFCPAAARPVKLIKANADPCTDCKNFFGDVVKILKNDSVQQEILKDIDKVCDYLGPDLGSRCQEYVSQYGPMVFNILLQYLDPTTICGEIGFCPAAARPVTLIKVDGDPCTDCKNFFGDVVKILKNDSVQQEILKKLSDLCNDLGPTFSPQCQQYVQQYGPLAFNFLLQYLDPTAICGDIGFCPGLLTPRRKFVSVNADQCTDCKNFFGDVVNILKQPATQQEILKELADLCNNLGPSIGPQCQQYVQQYGPLAFNFLLQYLDPTAICGDIGFCPALLTPGPKIVSMNGDQCTDCKNFFGDIVNMLKQPATQQEILKELSDLCNELGPSIGPQCQQYVQQYGPLVFDLLLQYLDPTAICGDIGFCPALLTPGTKIASVVPMMELTAARSTKVQGSPEVSGAVCKVCELVVKEVDTLLQDGTTEEEIVAALEKVCSVLPPFLAKQCNGFIETYGTVIIGLLVSQMNPDKVCSYLGLCSSNEELDATAECALCELVMAKLDTLLPVNATEEEIEAALGKVCSLMPSTLTEACESLVDQLTPQIVEILLLEVVPAKVCLALRLCSGQSAKTELVAGPDCALCEFVMNKLDGLINENSTEEQIERSLAIVCGLLPSSIRDDCVDLVEEYTPTIIQLLLQEVTPDKICSALGLCSSRTTLIEPVAGPECTLCEYIMKELVGLISKSSTEEEIEAALDKVCDLLPSSFKEECVTFVNEYTPTIIELLLQEVSPDEICQALGLCSSETALNDVTFGPQCMLCKYVLKELESMLDSESTVSEIEAALDKVCTFLPSKETAKCQELVDKYTQIIIDLVTQSVPPRVICMAIGLCILGDEPVQELDAGPECALCEYVMKELDGLISKTSTEEEIEAALDKVCDLLPSTIREECVTFVNEYTPTIIELLLQEVTPDKICSALGLCSSKTALNDVTFGPQCMLCKYVLKELESMLDKESTVSEIEAALDKVCTFLPSKETAKCQELVDKYTEIIINLVTQSVPPRVICMAIGLCILGDEPVQELDAGPECAVCEYVMKELDGLISKTSTQEEIEAALDEVCDLLPSTIREECVTFVNEYTPTIIQLLLQEVSPDKICSALGLCSSETTLNDVTFGPQCMLCKYVLKELEKMLDSESTVSEIEAALDKVCTFLPSKETAKCQELVDKYTQIIIDLVTQSVPPRVICMAIGLCILGDEPVQVTKAGPECVICEYVLTELDKLLVQEGTLSDIESALDKVCTLLPGTLTAQCQSFVTTYTETIVNLLVQNVPPQLICRAITLCKQGEPQQQEEPEVEAGELCAVCEFAISKLKKILLQPGTEAQIEAALNLVCGELPATVTATCKSFVDQYTREIIFLITQSVTPERVCSALTLCATESAVVEAVPAQSEERPPLAVTDTADVGASTECIVCEFAMGEVEKQLGKNATEEEIKSALNDVCDRLPESIREDCHTLISYYTTEVIYQLIRKNPPSKVCQVLKVCTNANSELKGVLHAPVEVRPRCALCEFIAKKLESLVQKESTEAEIRAALKKVCDLLPGMLTSGCLEIVDYYTEEIISLLVSQFPPEKLCSAIHLCAAVGLERGLGSANDVSVSCEICVVAVRGAELYITKNTTEAGIEKVLRQLCKTFPGGLQGQCLSFVETFGNVLPELIVALGDADKVCQMIDLCPRQSDMKQAAFEKCNTGPEFWCASQTNADLCNAVEHCKRHAWN